MTGCAKVRMRSVIRDSASLLKFKMITDTNNFENSKAKQFIIGKIISVLKNIYFVEVTREIESRQELFKTFAKVHSFLIPPYYLSSTSLGWKRDAVEGLDYISEKSIQYFPHFSNGDKERFSQIIIEVIEENIGNKEIFNFDFSFFDKSKSLFDLSQHSNPVAFAERLWEKIFVAFDKSINEWLIIYPLYRVYSSSFALNHDGIYLINPNESAFWQDLVSDFDTANNWYNSNDEIYDQILKRKDTTWLVCKVNGTDDGAKYSASKLMRTFIAVLFAQLYRQQPGLLNKVIKEPETFSVQFASNRKITKRNNMASKIGILFPSIGEEIVVSNKVQQDIFEWYRKRASLVEHEKNRFNVASQFIHYGVISSELERFIHFFIALDAMFGERGKVEATISEGIRKTFSNESIWKYKIEKLFDLRSELVHGGCSSIKEWNDINRYLKHTNSFPMKDVAIAVMTAFQQLNPLSFQKTFSRYERTRRMFSRKWKRKFTE